MRAFAPPTFPCIMSLADAPSHAFTELELSEDLIRRFDRNGPRYTSYPTADRFQFGYPVENYLQHLQKRARDPQAPPLSVYVHLPFCESLCYFCACNKIITQDHSQAARYLQVLFHELDLLSPHLADRRQTAQLHLGGGTPTFLSADELGRLMAQLRQHFDFLPDAELSVEIDPRTVTRESLGVLAKLGFRRTSFGVQDFNPQVQQAVNRIQPFEMVQAAMQASREQGFESVNADLIYGLPKQSLASFEVTLDQLVQLSPDRIALYNYAHLPERFKAQRLIQAEDLPSAQTRLQIFMMSIERLLDAGYVYIGLDHFAKPGDELNQARLQHHLHRNFQGYTTLAGLDMIGLGVSAIGKVGSAYIQNQHSLKAYREILAQDELPVSKGLELSAEDMLRREVIMDIMCSTPIDFAQFKARHGLDFKQHFAAELSQLEAHEAAGLLEISAQRLQVLPKGRLFVRALAMTFDAYAGQPQAARKFSRLI